MEPGATTGGAAAAGPSVAGPSSANLNDIELIDLTHDASDGEHQHAQNGDDCANQHCIQVQKSYRRQLNVKAQEIVTLGNTHKLAVAKKDQELTTIRSRARQLAKEKRELQSEKLALESKLKGRQRTERTWPAKLQAFITKGGNDGVYKDIHRLCSQEENMSSKASFTHPDVHFGVSSNGWKPKELAGNQVNPGSFHRFNELPAAIQAIIFRIWFDKGRRLIHCFSRLDPFQAPKTWPISNARSGLLNRFYWGKQRPLNLTKDTIDPQEALKLLLVSKSFCFKGVHAFYGLNTFAFSSFGEFDRFCKGIGPQRAARLQHIELTWKGNNVLCMKKIEVKDAKGKVHEHYNSLRSSALGFFLDLHCLRTVVIFIEESGENGEDCQPRPYETPAVKALMAAETANQPNHRLRRDLRTLQGLNYLYALRGLDCIKFYDFWPTMKEDNPLASRHDIRDTSFVADINSTVTMPKGSKKAKVSQLRELPYLFAPREENKKFDHKINKPKNSWDPTEEDWAAIELYFNRNKNQRSPYDSTRTYYGVHDLSESDDESDDADEADEANDADEPSSQQHRGATPITVADDSSIFVTDNESSASSPRPGPSAPRPSNLTAPAALFTAQVERTQMRLARPEALVGSLQENRVYNISRPRILPPPVIGPANRPGPVLHRSQPIAGPSRLPHQPIMLPTRMVRAAAPSPPETRPLGPAGNAINLPLRAPPGKSLSPDPDPKSKGKGKEISSPPKGNKRANEDGSVSPNPKAIKATETASPSGASSSGTAPHA